MNPIINIHQGMKRANDGELPLSPPIKRERTVYQELPHLEWSGVDMLPELVLSVVEFFSSKELLIFEQVAKGYEAFTQRKWKQLTKEERLDFDWADLQKETYPEKPRYRLGKAVIMYVEARAEKGIAKKPKAADFKSLFQRFEKAMLRFPSFGNFVIEDLSTQSDLLEGWFEEIDDDELTRNLENFESESTSNEFGGDLMLDGLLHIGIWDLMDIDPISDEGRDLQKRIFNSLMTAIQKNATCASYLALKFSTYPDPTVYYYQFATKSIEIRKDYRGLEQYLIIFKEEVDRLYNEGLRYPPILVAKANKSLDNEEKDRLLTLAIKDYGKYVPVRVLQNAGYVNVQLEKYREAHDLLTQAIAYYKGQGKEVHPSVLNHLAIVQSKLH